MTSKHVYTLNCLSLAYDCFMLLILTEILLGTVLTSRRLIAEAPNLWEIVTA